MNTSFSQSKRNHIAHISTRLCLFVLFLGTHQIACGSEDQVSTQEIPTSESHQSSQSVTDSTSEAKPGSRPVKKVVGSAFNCGTICAARGGVPVASKETFQSTYKNYQTVLHSNECECEIIDYKSFPYCVVGYTGWNFTGERFEFDCVKDAKDPANWGDKIGSFIVPPGKAIRTCRNSDMTGGCENIMGAGSSRVEWTTDTERREGWPGHPAVSAYKFLDDEEMKGLVEREDHRCGAEHSNATCSYGRRCSEAGFCQSGS